MGVYKEMGYLVREIQNRSKQIYREAADHGVPVYDYSDTIIKQTKGIMEMYGIKPKTEKYSTGFTQTFEFNGGVPAVIEAGFEKATVVFVSTDSRSGMKGYLYAHTHTSKSAANQARSYDY